MKVVQIFKTVGVALAAASVCAAAHAADVTGAGSTFAYPILAKWADAYKSSTNVGLNYQSIGSGGGIKQIKAKTVDFGASDMPLDAEDLEKNGLVQFPVIMGGVVPVVNVDGVKPGELKMSGDVLAKIYMGKVTKWNAPEIAALNPGVKLPADEIAVVHRADGSGTTFIWTNYLSKTSPDFKGTVGVGTAVKWPVGVGGKGNEGVAANVQRIKGAIGYVEYAYAKKNSMSYTLMKNHDGQIVKPEDKTFKAAAAGADWEKAPGFGVIVTDQPGKDSWPITGATFVLMHKVQDDPAKAKETLKFFDWSYNKGASMTTDLDYVAIPPSVVKLIEASWKANLKDASGKAIW
ncbi:MAG TPA: phosphate ABC transporter substrate-binding protein PstS [Noviherbaspirillum sp.]